ncbi:ABC transporter substrate-binding protein [Paenibacillus sp. GCM10027626]|uniref:ABC transporter substrate-binding protein n=1 Tax=Paenibacillus sp. GCM10027626 TaxID=3273411 RepID=UPI00362C8617
MIILTIMICFSLTLAGCGGNASQMPESRPDANKTVIRISFSGTELEKRVRYETAERFMQAHPEISIEWIDLGPNRYEKTLTLISGGNAPDILYINEWTLSLAERGVLLPLDDFIAGDASFRKQDFYPAVMEAYQFDGKQYGIPQEISPYVTYYNKDLFDQAGVPYPTDQWSEAQFMEAAARLTDPDKQQYGFLYDNYGAPLDGMLSRNNVEIYAADPAQSRLDSADALETLTTIKRMAVDDKSSPDPADIRAMGQGSESLFRNQHIAMFSAGMWHLPSFGNHPLPFNWDVVKMPRKRNQQTKVAALSWSISKDSKHPREAWEVLNYFTGIEGMRIVAKHSMALPAVSNKEVNSIILEAKFPQHIQAFVDSAPDIRMTEYKNERFSEINDIIAEVMDKLLLGDITPEEAQRQLLAKIEG